MPLDWDEVARRASGKTTGSTSRPTSSSMDKAMVAMTSIELLEAECRSQVATSFTVSMLVSMANRQLKNMELEDAIEFGREIVENLKDAITGVLGVSGLQEDSKFGEELGLPGSKEFFNELDGFFETRREELEKEIVSSIAMNRELSAEGIMRILSASTNVGKKAALKVIGKASNALADSDDFYKPEIVKTSIEPGGAKRNAYNWVPVLEDGVPKDASAANTNIEMYKDDGSPVDTSAVFPARVKVRRKKGTPLDFDNIAEIWSSEIRGNKSDKEGGE